MKSFQSYALLFVTAASILSACKKENENNPSDPAGNNSIPTSTNPAVTVQVVRVDQDANNYSAYTYNADGLLTGLVSVHNQVTTTAATTYNASKQVVSETVGDEIYKPVYTDGKITRINIYEKQNPQLATAYFTYSYTAGKVTEADYYVNDEQQNAVLALKTTSVYNAAGDPTSRKTYYQLPTGLTLASTATYEYDAKANPLAANFDVTSMLFGSQSVHNVTKQTLTDGIGNITQTDTYTITYNSSNYPSQISWKTVKPNKEDVRTVSKFTYKN